MNEKKMKDRQESNSCTAYKDDNGKPMVAFRTKIEYSFMAVPYKGKSGVLKFKPKKKKKKLQSK